MNVLTTNGQKGALPFSKKLLLKFHGSIIIDKTIKLQKNIRLITFSNIPNNFCQNKICEI